MPDSIKELDELRADVEREHQVIYQQYRAQGKSEIESTLDATITMLQRERTRLLLSAG